MSLIRRRSKIEPEIQPQEVQHAAPLEVKQKEPTPYEKEVNKGVVMRTHLRQLERDEAEAIAKRNEASASQTRHVNAEFFAKEEELARQAAEQNAKNKEAQRLRDKEAAARRIAENDNGYPYRKWSRNDVDPLLETSPWYIQEAAGYVPIAKRPKPIVVLQPHEPEEKPKFIAPRILTEAERTKEKADAIARMNAYLASRQ